MITLYGIPNCDTIKKARTFLENLGVKYRFHDFRTDGISAELVGNFVAYSSLEQLVNKRSTTYRMLDNQNTITIDTLVTYPTLIKRPVLDMGDKLVIGFKQAEYEALFT